MFEIRMTKTFRKDTERCRRRGYDMELLKTAIRLLEADGKLPATYPPRETHFFPPGHPMRMGPAVFVSGRCNKRTVPLLR